MPENYNQGDEIIVGNRRLRKIKRPKQHATPISTESAPNIYSQAPQNPSYDMQGNDQNAQNYASYDNTPFTYESAEPSDTQNIQMSANVPQYYEPQMNAQNTYAPQENYVQDDPYAYNQTDQTAYASSSSYLYGTIEKKKVLWIALLCLFVGVFIGALFFKGGDQVVQNGLQGVVINPEVPKGRARCGVSEKMQGCVLYVMNPQRQELNGRDFYDLASQLTGRQRFVIETGNMRYSSVKIRPGAIAQLNIPPLQ